MLPSSKPAVISSTVAPPTSMITRASRSLLPDGEMTRPPCFRIPESDGFDTRWHERKGGREGRTDGRGHGEQQDRPVEGCGVQAWNVRRRQCDERTHRRACQEEAHAGGTEGVHHAFSQQ